MRKGSAVLSLSYDLGLTLCRVCCILYLPFTLRIPFCLSRSRGFNNKKKFKKSNKIYGNLMYFSKEFFKIKRLK